MRFLIDAQLPPSLATWLAGLGHDADHINMIGLGAATDTEIWALARERRAVIVSKDSDFATIARRDADGPAVVWIRLGNTTAKALLRALQPLLPEILDGLARGERLIEVV